MSPENKHLSTSDLFKQPLLELIDPKHPLAKLTEWLGWSVFEISRSALFTSKAGRPVSSPRLIAGSLCLHTTLPVLMTACSTLGLRNLTGNTSAVKLMWNDY